jgi:hypothetical protein
MKHRTVLRRSGRAKREPHERPSGTPIGCTRRKCGAVGAGREARCEGYVSGGHAPRKYRPGSSCSHRSSQLPRKTTRWPPPGSAPRDPLHGQFESNDACLFLNTSSFHTCNDSIERWRCVQLRAWEGAATGQSTASRPFDARMPFEGGASQESKTTQWRRTLGRAYRGRK